MDIIRLRGIGVSPGIGMGEVVFSERVGFTWRKESIPAHQVGEELRRMNRAVSKTKDELVRIKAEIKKKMGEEHAFIFDAHLLILQDKSLLASLEKIIRDEKVKAEWALSQINAKYQKVFDSISDE
jgi:phosphotransferase system enzyme I (PtsI)